MEELTHVFDEAFLEALEELNPKLVKVLRKKKIMKAEMTPGRTMYHRHMLRFPTLKPQDVAGVPYDRQVEDDRIAIVLDTHPDLLIEQDKAKAALGVSAVRPLSFDSETEYFIDSYVLRRAGMKPASDARLLRVTYLGQEGHRFLLELEDKKRLFVDADAAVFGRPVSHEDTLLSYRDTQGAELEL